MRFSTYFLALISAPVFARAQFSVSGVATNDCNAPLESVTILLKKDSLIVGEGVCDPAGL